MRQQQPPQPIYPLTIPSLLSSHNDESFPNLNHDLEADFSLLAPADALDELETELDIWRRNANGPPQPSTQSHPRAIVTDPAWTSAPLPLNMSHPHHHPHAHAHPQHNPYAFSPTSPEYGFEPLYTTHDLGHHEPAQSTMNSNSNSNYPSSVSSNDPQLTQEEADLKRLRNTAASARFRAKKKKREQSLERAALEKRALLDSLEARIALLEAENKWLKDLIMERNDVRTTIERYEQELVEKETEEGGDSRRGRGKGMVGRGDGSGMGVG